MKRGLLPHTHCLWISLVLLSVLGCHTREISSSSKAQGDKAAKVKIFEDKFDRKELGASWLRGKGEGGQGQWRIQDGALVASDIKNDALWWTGDLPNKVRIEFDATAMSADGDLKFEIFGDGKTHESGYIGIFGGWSNALDVIARLDEHGKDRLAKPSMKVVPKKTYRFAIERTDSDLMWYIDDKLVLKYSDAKPLKGPNHKGFAFNDWTAPVKFDNFVVYRL